MRWQKMGIVQFYSILFIQKFQVAFCFLSLFLHLVFDVMPEFGLEIELGYFNSRFLHFEFEN